VTDTPRLDELPSLVDKGLRLVDERLTHSPSAPLYDSIAAQLTYVRQVVHGERQRDAATDDKLLVGLYAAREFETSDPPLADVLSKIHYLYDRWPDGGPPAAANPSLAGSPAPTSPATPAKSVTKPRAGTSPPKAGTVASVVVIMIGMAAALLWPGIFFLVQRQTGVRAMATVDECKTHGAGRYERTHCTGTWVVGGSLLDGGHIVVGSINGADQSDVGKTLDVTLRGDEAYTRGLALPLLLIGLGLIPVAAAVLLAWSVARTRRSK
jgi:hypothetical protein